MKPQVFLDSGIFIAALDRADRWHRDAAALFASENRWSTSLFVVSETHSWFLHRLGEEPARRFHAFLGALPGLQVFDATLELHRRVLRLLDRYRGVKLTYVDAASLCLIEEHRIRKVWGTDHHLGLTGADVVPRGH